MKKILLAVICFFGVQSSSIAQETQTTTTTDDNVKGQFYVSIGVAVPGDYKINDNLAAAGMPQINEALPEISFGYTITDRYILIDGEFNMNYLDKETNTDRLRAVVAGFKLRGHYIPVKTDKIFLSGGIDLSYVTSNFDLYTRGNTIDLNNLNPSTHTGHISLYNNQFYAGPSLAFGFFQNKSYPIRLNAGYEWALINGKWKSEFANVNNTFREDGLGRFYAKLTFRL